jgi:hypothetical protein
MIEKTTGNPKLDKIQNCIRGEENQKDGLHLEPIKLGKNKANDVQAGISDEGKVNQAQDPVGCDHIRIS